VLPRPPSKGEEPDERTEVTRLRFDDPVIYNAIAAEDILHDLGAFSMMASDSQAMGRVGEVIIRTWQTADKMKKQRGRLPDERGDNDNARVKRYVAKYTINPALTHGIARHVGSVEVGKLADLVVLSDDPLAVPDEKIKEIQVLATVVDGKIAYEKGGA